MLKCVTLELQRLPADACSSFSSSAAVMRRDDAFRDICSSLVLFRNAWTATYGAMWAAVTRPAKEQLIVFSRGSGLWLAAAQSTHSQQDVRLTLSGTQECFPFLYSSHFSCNVGNRDTRDNRDWLPASSCYCCKKLFDWTHQFLFLQSKAATPLESGVHLIPAGDTWSQTLLNHHKLSISTHYVLCIHQKSTADS